ncbi:hypothetical protein [Microcystis phage Mwe-JY08]
MIGLHHDLPEADYHADALTPAPSLSSSIANVILQETPRHAWAQHPRLGGARDEETNRKRDLGTVVHQLLTRKGRGFTVIDAADFRTKAAQEAAATARAEGRTPVLASDYGAALEIRDAVLNRLSVIKGCGEAFVQGEGEVSGFWLDEQFGIWGRMRMDWLSDDATIWDLKTTSGGLADRQLAARIAEGYDVQAGWYERGMIALYPELEGRIRYRWVFVETSAPFEVRVIEADNTTMELGRRKAAYAAAIFAECLGANHWPGFPAEIARLDYPGWAQSQWMERELVAEERGIQFLQRAPIPHRDRGELTVIAP